MESILSESVVTENNNSQQRPKRPSRSIVNCWTGPRGGGKTLAMTFDAILHMVRGFKVWSNYKISIDTDIEKIGVFKHYESLPLNMQTLYEMDSSIAEGWVYLDEFTLWCDNRRSQTTGNALINGLFTMIRHRQLSFGIATQQFEWLDKRIQFQVDTLAECSDLHFKYNHLPPGALIGLRIKDLSGLATGLPFYLSERVEIRQLYGLPFWGCYDSWEDYDYFEAHKKVRLNDKQAEENENKVADVTNFLRQSGQTEIGTTELAEMLKDSGCTWTMRQCGSYLKKAGFTYHRSTGKKGNTYLIQE